MSEALFDVSGITITITAVYGTASFLILILFMSLWLMGRKKRSGKPIFAGQVMNGVGFGILPAVSLLKALQEMSTGNGSVTPDPIPKIPWLTVNDCYRPGRIEAVAALALFLIMCLWLIARKNEIPDNGDLLIISLCIWAAIRLVTEDFRDDPMDLFRFTSCGTIVSCLLLWIIRRTWIHPSKLRSIIDILSVGTCVAVNLLTSFSILNAGSEIANFSVKTGSAGLMLVFTLIVGSDLRNMQQKTPVQTGA